MEIWRRVVALVEPFALPLEGFDSLLLLFRLPRWMQLVLVFGVGSLLGAFLLVPQNVLLLDGSLPTVLFLFLVLLFLVDNRRRSDVALAAARYEEAVLDLDALVHLVIIFRCL
uniref:(northern house mosquito) hypothetical protein n=1 Tax=Culex pipiens TaxID=7175 RepID=A0A8D8J7U0_CULPI